LVSVSFWRYGAVVAVKHQKRIRRGTEKVLRRVTA
jgi:hypothetical protein